jgi:Flp pilus assembly protein TadG
VRRVGQGEAEDGNAMIEFVWLSVLLMVPLVYVLICVFEVQRASFAVTEGAREAGRAYATADSVADARARAQDGARLALADQGIGGDPDLTVACSGPCLANGSTVTITVRHTVRLPVLSLLGSLSPQIPVSASHDEVVDTYQVPRG